METVAARHTRKPCARARWIPSRARAHEPRPRWRSCSSGVALSRLICRTIRSRGNAARLSARRPANRIPLVNTVVGAAAAQHARISPMFSSRKGSPPVTKISLTPSAGASRAIRCNIQIDVDSHHNACIPQFRERLEIASSCARLYCAFIQVSEPVSFTAKSVMKMCRGLPSAVPRCSVEISRGPAFL